MNFELNRYSKISLILFYLLNENYHCTFYVIKFLKNIEIKDSIKYHIERFRFKHLEFTTDYFLFSLIDMKRIKNKKNKKKFQKIFDELPPEKYLNNLELINKYNIILQIPDLPIENKKIILKMKQNKYF